MGALSRLTGDGRYENAALRAHYKLWSMRSSLNLLGTTLDVETGEWLEHSSGIGAGVDSFYEYLNKARILFGKDEFWMMFQSAYLGLQKYFRHGPWYHEADMRTGLATFWQLTSLQSFWPGVQVFVGDIIAANSSRHEFFYVWEKYGVLQGIMHVLIECTALSVISLLRTHFTLRYLLKYYPLRPELAESTFYLYQATKDPWYMEVGESIVNSLNQYTKVEGGFASIRDVTTMQLEDHQHTFFLAETCKYLYLLFDDSKVFVAAITKRKQAQRESRYVLQMWICSMEAKPSCSNAFLPHRQPSALFCIQKLQVLRQGLHQNRRWKSDEGNSMEIMHGITS